MNYTLIYHDINHIGKKRLITQLYNNIHAKRLTIIFVSKPNYHHHSYSEILNHGTHDI